MQRFNLIVGSRQEGKTVELLMEYANNYLVTYLSKDEKDEIVSKNLRDAVRLVYINGLEENIFESNNLKDMLELTIAERDIDTIVNGTHISYSNVNSWFKLIKIIKDEVSKGDCIFFLDNCEKHEKIKEFINFLMCYPNQDCKHSFDINMTYNRD